MNSITNSNSILNLLMQIRIPFSTKNLVINLKSGKVCGKRWPEKDFSLEFEVLFNDVLRFRKRQIFAKNCSFCRVICSSLMEKFIFNFRLLWTLIDFIIQNLESTKKTEKKEKKRNNFFSKICKSEAVKSVKLSWSRIKIYNFADVMPFYEAFISR